MFLTIVWTFSAFKPQDISVWETSHYDFKQAAAHGFWTYLSSHEILISIYRIGKIIKHDWNLTLRHKLFRDYH